MLAQTEIISNLAGLAHLRADWNQLAAHVPNPLLRYEWFASCADAFCDAADLAVVVVRDAEKVCAIAPMMVIRQLGAARMEVLGHHPLYEPSGLLYTDEDGLRRLLIALVQFGLPIRLDKFQLESRELRLVREILPRTWVLLERSGGASTAARVPREWSAFEATMSGDRRYAIRRYHKRAQRTGAVSFQVVAPTAATAATPLHELFLIESSGWKHRAGTGILDDRKMHRFFNRYAHETANCDMLRLFFLRIGGEVAAAKMAIEYAGKLWEMKIGYDERFRHCSPGILLQQEIFRYACQQGLSEYEFLGSAERWQRHWAIDYRLYKTLRMYPLASASGPLTLAQDVARFALSKASLPRLVRTRKTEPFVQ